MESYDYKTVSGNDAGEASQEELLQNTGTENETDSNESEQESSGADEETSNNELDQETVEVQEQGQEQSQEENPEQSVESGVLDSTYDVMFNAVNDAIVVNQVVTDNQAISSTALDYFKGVLGNELPFTDYVVYCGQPYTYDNYGTERTAYEYCMAYGDLENTDTYFTGTADVVTIRTVGEYSVSYVNDVSISLYAPQYYSRSNLGNYSGIIAYDYISLAVLVLLGIGGLMCFLDKIFGFRWR